MISQSMFKLPEGSTSQGVEQSIGRCAGQHAPDFQSPLGLFVLAQEVHHDAPQDREVLGGVLHAHTTLVFTEADAK